MWEMVSNVMPNVGRMGRRNRGMNTITAMLLGAGIGIATWEVMRRTNAGNLANTNIGQAASKMANTNRGENAGENGRSNAAPANNNLGDVAGNGMNETSIAQMANEVLSAIR